MDAIVLKYQGNGGYISGVPATDLTAAAIAASGFTVDEIKAYKNGTEPLYVDADATPAEPPPISEPVEPGADAPGEE
jgi:hypothetical protein